MTLFLRTYKITLLKRTLDIFTSSNMHAISNPKILLVHAIQANTFAGRVFSSAHEDFASMGIMVISYTVKEVHDDVGYLSALGQSRTAEVLRDARVGEAKARMESQVAEAKAEEQRLFNIHRVDFDNFVDYRLFCLFHYYRFSSTSKCSISFKFINFYDLEKYSRIFLFSMIFGDFRLLSMVLNYFDFRYFVIFIKFRRLC